MSVYRTTLAEGLFLDLETQPQNGNEVNNYTPVNVKIFLRTTTGRVSASATKKGTLIVDGTKYDFSVIVGTLGYNSSKLLKEVTKNVYHNDDGTKTLNVSCSFALNITFAGSWIGTGSVSGSEKLKDISRASKPTFEGIKEVGETITINTNRTSSNFTHDIKFEWYSNSGLIGTDIATNIGWTIPKDFANNIPNSNNGTLKIIVETFNNGTKIGTTSTDVNISIPNTEEFNPKIMDIILDEAVSGLNEQFEGFVQSKSKINGSVTAAGSYSSTIKSYNISINGQTFANKIFTTDLLIDSGSCAVTVTDSRNRSTTLTKNYTCISYENPKIEMFNVERCDSNGELNDEGSNALCTINASISSINNKNTKSFKILYKKQKETAFSEVTLIDSSYLLNTTNVILNIDIDYEYDFKFVVSDYFNLNSNSIIKNKELGTGFTLINWNPSGKAMALGKVSKYDNAFEINMPIFDRFDTQITNGLALSNSKSIDPNTSLEELIFTNHENAPENSKGAYFFIKTIFFETKEDVASRQQIAYQFMGTNHVYSRFFIEENGWSSWKLISSNINITTDAAAVPTGRIIDEKIEYVKRINFGELPNATTKKVATDLILSDITITRVDTIARKDNGDVNIVPFIQTNNLGYGIAAYLRSEDNTFVVDTGSIDRSDYSMKIDIYYVKN